MSEKETIDEIERLTKELFDDAKELEKYRLNRNRIRRAQGKARELSRRICQSYDRLIAEQDETVREHRSRNIRFWRIWAKLERGQPIDGGERNYFVSLLKYWLKQDPHGITKKFMVFLVRVAEGKERLIFDGNYRRWKRRAAIEAASGSPIELWGAGGRASLNIHHV
jgi:hypothetical protein